MIEKDGKTAGFNAHLPMKVRHALAGWRRPGGILRICSWNPCGCLVCGAATRRG